VVLKILDRREIGVGIQHLCGHRMAKMVTGDFQVCSPGIIFHPFLDAASGYRLPGERPFPTRKIFFILVAGLTLRYPNEIWHLFAEFIDNVWLKEHSVEYFKDRDPKALNYLPKLLPSK
jgi:hypothetical protein